ncbi:MAG TPA: cupin domain-containing protein [Burkholderiaceae bacterium]|jgi:50S ribosomal protein L16 3-hydroxylase|nr:cupin domain-containing protein [Burkholderiaceae bacterium]
MPSSQQIELPTALLGGLSPQQFMQRHWHKRPRLIRQAMPGVEPPVSRVRLFELAASERVESRLIVKSDGQWKLKTGPLSRRMLPSLSQREWTLLVQGVDLHEPRARELLDRFRFVPEARLDDLMISWASDGGGVGPHFDSYDVFLLQVQGRRTWRIGRLRDPELVEGLPLKILSNFEPEETWTLEPGDMLYLPPLWAHDGVAQGECITCSIGFRAPAARALAREVLGRMLDADDEHADDRRLYRDPKQPATVTPAHVPQTLRDFAHEAVARALSDERLFDAALGEALTEPKPQVWFDPGMPLLDGAGVVLDARTRMLYDAHHVFINGESWRAGGADARLMRRLADRRRLSSNELARASSEARELLDQWAEDGWLHSEGDVDGHD